MHIFENSDIILLTELGNSDLYNYEVNGFETIKLHRTDMKVGTKRSSGGLIIYIRSKFCDKDMIIKTVADDIHVIWLGYKQGVLSNKYVFVCLCYVMPVLTSREPLVDVSVYDRLLLHISKFEAKHSDNCSFIVCGDMNARTSTLSNMVIDDNSMHVPLPDKYVCDDIIPRCSEDKVVNTNGHLHTEFCKQASLIMINGRCGLDRSVGKFTFNGHLGQSVIDYILVSRDLYEQIAEFSVGVQNIISDHSILSFTLPTSVVNEEVDYYTQEDVFESVNYKHIWKTENRDIFKNNLSGSSQVQ